MKFGLVCIVFVFVLAVSIYAQVPPPPPSVEVPSIGGSAAPPTDSNGDQTDDIQPENQDDLVTAETDPSTDQTNNSTSVEPRPTSDNQNPGSTSSSADFDHCSDGILSGNEQDIDCGGSCAACIDDSACTQDSDCGPGICDTFTGECIDQATTPVNQQQESPAAAQTPSQSQQAQTNTEGLTVEETRANSSTLLLVITSVGIFLILAVLALILIKNKRKHGSEKTVQNQAAHPATQLNQAHLQQARDYITQGIAQGHAPESLRASLLQRGWQQEYVDEAMKGY